MYIRKVGEWDMLSLQTDKSDGSAKNKLDSSEPIISWDESLKLGHESLKARPCPFILILS